MSNSGSLTTALPPKQSQNTTTNEDSVTEQTVIAKIEETSQNQKEVIKKVSLTNVPKSPRLFRFIKGGASVVGNQIRSGSPVGLPSTRVRLPSPLAFDRNKRKQIPLPKMTNGQEEIAKKCEDTAATNSEVIEEVHPETKMESLLTVKTDNVSPSPLTSPSVLSVTSSVVSQKESPGVDQSECEKEEDHSAEDKEVEHYCQPSSSGMRTTASEVTMHFSEDNSEDLQFAMDSDLQKCSSVVSSPLFASKYKHSKDMSEDSGSHILFSNRAGLTIDNSCFDLLATTAENSTVNTPVEKVFPRFGPDCFQSLPFSPPFTDSFPLSPSFLDKVSEEDAEQKTFREEMRNESFDFTIDHLSVMGISITSEGTGENEGEVEDTTSPESSEIPESESSSRKPSVFSETQSTVETEQALIETTEPEMLSESLKKEVIPPVNNSPKISQASLLSPINPLVPNQKLKEQLNQPITVLRDIQTPSTSKNIKEIPKKTIGRTVGDLRLIEILRVRIVQFKGLRGSSSKPVYILAKVDNKDVHQSGAIAKNANDSILEEFSHDVVNHFSYLHLVILEGARAGKTPRPIGRVSLKRKDIVRNCGREQFLPLRVVSKFSDVQGQICLDIRRTENTFSIRVVDYSDLNLREPQELYLLVSTEEEKESKKLKIGAQRCSDEWLEMNCPRQGTLSLKMSLWHDLLRGLNSVFHGQIRVDVDERWTNGPSKWFYLRPRIVDSEKYSDGKEQRPQLAKKESSSLGEMKLWVSYTADHILPMATYNPLLEELSKTTNAVSYKASAVAVLEALPHADLGSIARPLVQLFVHTGEIRQFLKVLYQQDIRKCTDMNTLFRSQTLATKSLFELLKLYGHQYLTVTLKPVIDKIYNERRSCEIDPSRLAPGESLDKHMENLLSYFTLCFTRVVDSAYRCPLSLRMVFADLRKVVSDHTHRPEIERLALSSFLIMRFFAAAILNPRSFGIKREQADSKVSRTLVLMSKILQRLANEVVSTQPLSSKEPWLEPILKKVTDDEHRLSMMRFLDKISLQFSEPSVSAESVSVLKDGLLVEVKSGRRWKVMQNQKKRMVVLTDSELSWQKNRKSGILDQKGSFSLAEIEDVIPGEKTTFTIRTNQGEICFEAASPIEMDEWVSSIEKQRARARRIGGPRSDLRDLLETDVEREVEGLHVLLVEHADTLVTWKNGLDGSAPLPEGSPSMPGGFDAEKCSPEEKEELMCTMDNMLAITYAIETAHREAMNKFMTQMCNGAGTRENPIGDENYLLLKRKLNLQ